MEHSHSTTPTHFVVGFPSVHPHPQSRHIPIEGSTLRDLCAADGHTSILEVDVGKRLEQHVHVWVLQNTPNLEDSNDGQKRQCWSIEKQWNKHN